jgi:hypothetical protein
VEADIQKLSSNVPALDRPVRDDRDADRAQKVLVAIGQRRSQLVGCYVAVLGVHEQLKAYHDTVKNWLYRKPEIQECKNETARTSCMAQVLAPVISLLGSLSRHLKQMEAIQWALRANQESVAAQIRVWTTQSRDT